ncbi:zinc finger protein CONSTANS-LIKE 12 [Pyrus ussuriensis x Pyrus communis]|uniref:Zinc finger protein CONSTANS-LIKE 12 n=1 Tax=Pyrus ussuriensis x Pyrus communis TaxID=2448454 RepID=A0A5N5I244_9ROSA|nr:zinc finger protein CONSTANS-LIKE 12 [Pyrus ussuriensis x Pyrus communis]KAB2634276.1 zinc finger protein CONSTANS-LIKE 12 [Pyrus ussuriensis x Pyrus communis]
MNNEIESSSDRSFNQAVVNIKVYRGLAKRFDPKWSKSFLGPKNLLVDGATVVDVRPMVDQ